MGYDDYDDFNSHPSSFFSQISGKKLAALAIVVIVAAIFGFQAMVGFPLKDLFRKEITTEAKVVIKDNHSTCIVEASDHEPRSIPNCPYKKGDTLIVTYKDRTMPIEKYHLKS